MINKISFLRNWLTISAFSLILIAFPCTIGASSLERGLNNTPLPKAKVLTGIDVLQKNNFKELRGKRIGLITNPTGVNANLRTTIDILHESAEVELVALFGPEHGVRGEIHAGGKVAEAIDGQTNLPIYSLYGNLKQPAKEMLKGLDAIVYDIQDIGTRSYTYISTMGRSMAVAAENDLEFIVLDRPNPLGGEKVEGSLVEDGFFSFVSEFKIPYIYGLTCGELAVLLNEEGLLKDGIQCNLTVVEMEGWKRNMFFDDTGLPWVMTSPHIPTPEAAYSYPATGILGELGVISIGVGYTQPFQIIATEEISAEEFAEAMNAHNLDGVYFRPIYFQPFYGSLKGKVLGGIQIHFTDLSKARLTDIQFVAVETLYRTFIYHPLFEKVDKARFDMFDKVMGSDYYRKEFSKNFMFDDIREHWMKDEEDFKLLSSKYYLYL